MVYKNGTNKESFVVSFGYCLFAVPLQLSSGGSKGGRPLFWVTKEEMTEGRKASRVR